MEQGPVKPIKLPDDKSIFDAIQDRMDRQSTMLFSVSERVCRLEEEAQRREVEQRNRQERKTKLQVIAMVIVFGLLLVGVGNFVGWLLWGR